MSEKPNTYLKVRIAQMAVRQGDVAANLEEISGRIAAAGKSGADLIVFPELCTTGLNWKVNAGLEVPSREAIEHIQGECARNQISLIGSFLDFETGAKPSNTLYVFGTDGSVAKIYRKVHLFTLFEEEKHLEAGRQIAYVDTRWGRFGLSICYDLRFPELFRSLALAGAEVQFLPSAFPFPRLAHWQTLVRARAIENQNFFLAVNQAGYEGGSAGERKVRYFGHSMLVDPWGEVLYEGGEEPEAVDVDIDLTRVQEARNRLSSLKDRQPEIYNRSSGNL